jgi:hypothetical protein
LSLQAPARIPARGFGSTDAAAGVSH